MTRRTLTDAERIVSIRAVIEATHGDWHEATALYSIGADLNWLLDKVAVLSEATTVSEPALDVNVLAKAIYATRMPAVVADTWVSDDECRTWASRVAAEYARLAASQTPEPERK